MLEAMNYGEQVLMNHPFFGPDQGFRNRAALGEIENMKNLSPEELQQLKLEYRELPVHRKQKASMMEVLKRFISRRNLN